MIPLHLALLINIALDPKFYFHFIGFLVLFSPFPVESRGLRNVGIAICIPTLRSLKSQSENKF
jgi:hypothetical protein